MEIKIIKCDRCKKKIEIEIEDIWPQIEITTSHLSKDKKYDKYDLCYDCESSLNFFLSYKPYGKKMDERLKEYITQEEERKE